MSDEQKPAEMADVKVLVLYSDGKATELVRVGGNQLKTYEDAAANSVAFKLSSKHHLTVGAVYTVQATADLGRIRPSFAYVGMHTDKDLVAELQARRMARDNAAKAAKEEVKGKEAWLDYLEPIRRAYMGSSSAGKAALLARVVRYVLSGR